MLIELLILVILIIFLFELYFTCSILLQSIKIFIYYKCIYIYRVYVNTNMMFEIIHIIYIHIIRTILTGIFTTLLIVKLCT